PGEAGGQSLADDERGFGLKRVEQADEVADQVEDRVLIERLRPVARAVAAHVGRYGMKTGCCERTYLVAPGIPGFRKAVAEQHQRPFALLGNVEMDAVCLNQSLRWFAHVFGPSCALAM